MKFGKSFDEVKKSGGGGGGDGAYLRTLKNGENIFRVLQNKEEWVGWWEHYDPTKVREGSQYPGVSYPCLEDDRENCPGCNDERERVKNASRKIGFNVLMASKNGKFYVNGIKIPRTLADKLEGRQDRNPEKTLLDRDFMVFRSGEAPQIDYDLEGQDIKPISSEDMAKYREKFLDIPEILGKQFEEAHPGFVPGSGSSSPSAGASQSGSDESSEPKSSDSTTNSTTSSASGTENSPESSGTTEPLDKDEEIERLKGEIARRQQETKDNAPAGSMQEKTGDPADPPSETEGDAKPEVEEVEVSLDDLKSMTKDELFALIEKDADLPEIPNDLRDKSVDKVVEWIVDHAE